MTFVMNDQAACKLCTLTVRPFARSLKCSSHSSTVCERIMTRRKRRFLDGVVAQAPHPLERATETERERPPLAEAMRVLIGCAGKFYREDGRLLEDKFCAFNKKLMHDEARENELLLKAHDDDIGAHDQNDSTFVVAPPYFCWPLFRERY